MKYFLITATILIHLTATAQSPHLSILLKMDSANSEIHGYRIEMKICTPKKMTKRGDWFSHDTSTIDFAALKANDLDCGEYFEKGTPTLISGEEERPPFNQFEFSNQVFAWEGIYVFRISDVSSRGWWPPMYVVLPMKYKSFWTKVDLTGLEFRSGEVMFLTDINAAYVDRRLVIRQSLKNEKTVDVKNFPLKELLEKE